VADTAQVDIPLASIISHTPVPVAHLLLQVVDAPAHIPGWLFIILCFLGCRLWIYHL